MQKISIRWFIQRDMPNVLKLQENLDFSWEEKDFIETLVQSNCIGMVAEANGEIVGYMVYELYKEYFYIVNLAVKDTKRRQKIGSQLVGLLQNKLSHHRRIFLSTNVRESQLPTQLFLKQLGFKASLVKDYYENEDSYYFKYKLKEV